MGILFASDGGEGPEERRIGDGPATGKPKSDPLFDGWLKHHLSRLYDPVIQEPVPSDLLRLLEEKLG